MKVAFDENVPAAMVRVFQSLAGERKMSRLTDGLKIYSSKDYTPSPQDRDYAKGCDVPWIRRFAKAGGTGILSVDPKMMKKPHERLALVQEGMVVVFFASAWSGMTFFPKCASLLSWWPIIATTFREASAPSFWRVPSKATPEGPLDQLPTEDLQLMRMERQKATRDRIAAERRRKRRNSAAVQGQATLDLPASPDQGGSSHE